MVKSHEAKRRQAGKSGRSTLRRRRHWHAVFRLLGRRRTSAGRALPGYSDPTDFCRRIGQSLGLATRTTNSRKGAGKGEGMKNFLALGSSVMVAGAVSAESTTVDQLMMITVGVGDVDKSKAFYTLLGCKAVQDYSKDGRRWVTLQFPGGGTTITLSTVMENLKPGENTIYPQDRGRGGGVERGEGPGCEGDAGAHQAGVAGVAVGRVVRPGRPRRQRCPRRAIEGPGEVDPFKREPCVSCIMQVLPHVLASAGALAAMKRASRNARFAVAVPPEMRNTVARSTPTGRIIRTFRISGMSRCGPG